jgi:prepilin-type N-terminal cleavage/methylation domain-containing protein
MLRPIARGASGPARRGFTLIELLVAMAILVALAALALLVVPGVMEQDRTTDGASMTRQYMMIAKARAARDGLPRGVRLIVALDPSNPAKSDARWVTEIQYTEAPPVVVGNRTPNAGVFNTTTNTVGPPTLPQPYVFFKYDLTTGARQAFLSSTSTNVINQITSDLAIPRYPMMFLPDLRDPANVADVGFWCRVTAYNSTTGEVTLDRYPDLGAANQLVTYDFGIYGAPRPLPAEPTQPLPREVCIDLASSSPAGGSTADYDILFAPNGQVINSTGQINLWVRNYRKPGGNGGNFANGGEQQVVALKTKSGSVGVFPISWTAGQPFEFALRGATGFGD